MLFERVSQERRTSSRRGGHRHHGAGAWRHRSWIKFRRSSGGQSGHGKRHRIRESSSDSRRRNRKRGGLARRYGLRGRWAGDRKIRDRQREGCGSSAARQRIEYRNQNGAPSGKVAGGNQGRHLRRANDRRRQRHAVPLHYRAGQKVRASQR